MLPTTQAILELLVGDLDGPFPAPPRPRKKRGRRRKYPIHIPGKTRQQIGRAFWQLRKKELISWKEDKNSVHIVLTEKSKQKILGYDLEKLALKQPKRWDKKWRIVAFDIPKQKHKARTALTRKLKDLGLLQFQKSVWLYPFPCQDEVDFVAEIFEVGQYVHHIEATNITNNDNLLNYFDL